MLICIVVELIGLFKDFGGLVKCINEINISNFFIEFCKMLVVLFNEVVIIIEDEVEMKLVLV